MKKLLLLFSHILTEDQIKDAQKNLNCDEIIYLPKELQEKWSNVNPSKIENNELDKIKEFVEKNINKKDYVLIQGEWGFTYKMINFAKEKGYIPIYSTTKRKSTEIICDDGSLKKTMIFKHVKYKRY